MSGTSLDGIDAALVSFDENNTTLHAFHYLPFTETLKSAIAKISLPDLDIKLIELGQLDSHLGALFSSVALELIALTDLTTSDITAIGSHGQTIYHAPIGEFGFSMQIGDPNRIAFNTGITTIADFRRKDIAAGGHGAPLVPAFHQHAFNPEFGKKVIVNIGGIANISILNGTNVSGYDTGPGNTLMDQWCYKHLKQSYDKGGNWALTGKSNPQLLQLLKSDPYFTLEAPKSTGKEYFSLNWLNHYLQLSAQTYEPADIQATLSKLTAETIKDAVNFSSPQATEVLVCGGGAHNVSLIKNLENLFDIPVRSTQVRNIHPDHVEAIAFAWLAKQTLNRLPGNLPSVTGASSPVVLGGIFLPG